MAICIVLVAERTTDFHHTFASPSIMIGVGAASLKLTGPITPIVISCLTRFACGQATVPIFQVAIVAAFAQVTMHHAVAAGGNMICPRFVSITNPHFEVVEVHIFDQTG